MPRQVRLFDGPLASAPCVSQTAYARCDDCKEEHPCAVRWVLKEVRDASAKILDQTTLDQVVSKSNQLCGIDGLEYQI